MGDHHEKSKNFSVFTFFRDDEKVGEKGKKIKQTRQ